MQLEITQIYFFDRKENHWTWSFKFQVVIIHLSSFSLSFAGYRRQLSSLTESKSFFLDSTFHNTMESKCLIDIITWNLNNWLLFFEYIFFCCLFLFLTFLIFFIILCIRSYDWGFVIHFHFEYLIYFNCICLSYLFFCLYFFIWHIENFYIYYSF